MAVLAEAGVEGRIERFRAASERMRAYRRGRRWDLIFLDIMMEGQDGIETAEALRAAGDDTDLNFINICRRRLRRSPASRLSGTRPDLTAAESPQWPELVIVGFLGEKVRLILSDNDLM